VSKAILPRAAWVHVWKWTIGILLAGTVGSWVVTTLINILLGQQMDFGGLVLSLVMPWVLGGPILFFLQVRSAQLKEANRRLETLASTDWLTGLLNRRSFSLRVSEELAHGRGGALLVIDADFFKTINDRFGHERGDEVLQMLATAIRDGVREVDFVGRLGGEEFGVFLDSAGYETTLVVADRIRLGVNRLFVKSHGVAQRLSVSIGGAVSEGESDFPQLFRLADERLYAAKHAGRNRVNLGGGGDDAPRAVVGG